jgi:hypothetical protein
MERRSARQFGALQQQDIPLTTLGEVVDACVQRPGQLMLVSGFYQHKESDILLYGEGRLINCLDDPEVGSVEDVEQMMPDYQEASPVFVEFFDWGALHDPLDVFRVRRLGVDLVGYLWLDAHQRRPFVVTARFTMLMTVEMMRLRIK